MSGCAEQPAPVVVPAAILAPTPVPAFRGETNGDLLDHVLDLRNAVDLCNADKKAAGEILGGVE